MTIDELEQEIQNKIQFQFTGNTLKLLNTYCSCYRFENYAIHTDYEALFLVFLIDKHGWSKTIYKTDSEYLNILIKINEDLSIRKLGYKDHITENRDDVIKRFLLK